MTDTYDLLVIGAGMAGVAAATKTSSKGWRVGIVDALPYGGTCALRGCDPKKILRRGARKSLTQPGSWAVKASTVMGSPLTGKI